MYEILFDYLAIDYLNNMPKEIKLRIYSKIISTKENPLHYFEKLTGREDFKLRVGSYRVIADIDNEAKIIKITHIGHRKNIYKNI